MTNRRKSCKRCKTVAKTLPFVDLPGKLPSVPVVDGMFYSGQQQDDEPAENLRTPGFRSSRMRKAGEAESADAGRTSERTESTPGLRKGFRRPNSFIEQEGQVEAVALAEVANGNSGVDRSVGKSEDGTTEPNEGKTQEEQKEQKHQEPRHQEKKATSCTGESRDGGCSGKEGRKSVAVTTTNKSSNSPHLPKSDSGSAVLDTSLTSEEAKECTINAADMLNEAIGTLIPAPEGSAIRDNLIKLAQQRSAFQAAWEKFDNASLTKKEATLENIMIEAKRNKEHDSGTSGISYTLATTIKPLKKHYEWVMRDISDSFQSFHPGGYTSIVTCEIFMDFLYRYFLEDNFFICFHDHQTPKKNGEFYPDIDFKTVKECLLTEGEAITKIGNLKNLDEKELKKEWQKAVYDDGTGAKLLSWYLFNEEF